MSDFKLEAVLPGNAHHHHQHYDHQDYPDYLIQHQHRHHNPHQDNPDSHTRHCQHLIQGLNHQRVGVKKENDPTAQVVFVEREGEQMVMRRRRRGRKGGRAHKLPSSKGSLSFFHF